MNKELSIWQRKNKIEESRRKYMLKVMKPYDDSTYLPELFKLREECEKIGHSIGSSPIHNNGLGRTFVCCNNCGKCIDI